MQGAKLKSYTLSSELHRERLQLSLADLFRGSLRRPQLKEEQTMTAKVTVEEVERVAELAHLELTPEETPRMLGDLNAILEYVAELNELDTTGVTPLAQVSELKNAAGESVLRDDLLRPSLDRAVVMCQAPETDGVFFKVPKVIER
jgi:aspartyl-tRNA(Asn)/glutamyl-tRNA(Gln) amidotransferase subunit C